MEEKQIPLEELSKEQLDKIREIASIGCGHGATALSELLGDRNIKMEVPSVRVVPIEEVAYALLEDDEQRSETLAGILMETQDDYPLDIVILLDKKTLDFMFQSVMLSDMTDFYNLTDFEKSMITEIGNILILHLVSALESSTSTKMRPEYSPVLSIDLAEALLNAVAIKIGPKISSVLLIETRLFTEDRDVNAVSLLLPSEQVLSELIKGLPS